jgi:hypothetical protein
MWLCCGCFNVHLVDTPRSLLGRGACRPHTWHALCLDSGGIQWRTSILDSLYPGHCRRTNALVEELSVPPPGSQPLHFSSRYPRNFVRSFACLFRFLSSRPPASATEVSAVFAAVLILPCIASKFDICGDRIRNADINIQHALQWSQFRTNLWKNNATYW